jgi:hypothetical protein
MVSSAGSSTTLNHSLNAALLMLVLPVPVPTCILVATGATVKMLQFLSMFLYQQPDQQVLFL